MKKKSHGSGKAAKPKAAIPELPEFMKRILQRQRADEEASVRVREEAAEIATDYRNIITVEAGKRGGKPCIRGMRISVGDILGWLASGISEAEMLSDYPELTSEDIRAALAYAADRENKLQPSNGWLEGESPLSSLARKWRGKFTLPKSDPENSRRDYLLKKYWRRRA